MKSDKNLLKEHLLEIIDSDDVQNLVDKECREFINNNITTNYPESHEALKPIIDNLSFPIIVERQETLNLNTWLRRVSILLFTLIGYLIFKSLFALPVAGVVLGFIIGELCIEICLYKVFDKQKNNANKKKEQIENICNMVENICNNAGNICKKTKTSLNVKPKNDLKDDGADYNCNEILEKKFYRILQWFHSALETIEGNDWVEDDIKKLLNRYEYDLVYYTASNASFFEQTYGHVKSPTTSLPALINIKTNTCIINGHVIIPLN